MLLREKEKMRVLVFDTETTGLPDGHPSFYETEKWPHVVQLSYSLYDTTLKKVILENDNIIAVDDNVIISPKSIEMHKITKKISQNKGMPIEDALQCFNACMIGADILMAHNLSFDKRMLIVEHIRCQKRVNNFKKYPLRRGMFFPKDLKEMCTMRASKDLCNIKAISSRDGEEYIKFPSLSELHYKLFGVLPNQKIIHNSLIDVQLCLKCGISLIDMQQN